VSSKNFLETLYESGISPRELLHLYISESHEQVWDDGLQEMFECRVLNTLVSGEYLALGYSADSRGELVAIPPHRWRFLELDIIEGKAKGEDVRYTGVFITGHRGESLSLKKSQDTLSVFGPDGIIRGLTDELYVTAPGKYAISSAQRKKALDVLGRLGKIPDGPAEVAGFNRIRRLSAEAGIEIWEATSHQGELRSDWLLKEVDITSGDAPAQIAAESLKSEYIRYQQLYGVPGIATCAPLISDGERLILPIRQPAGQHRQKIIYLIF
jgi:hypothetical protein|tara:strand:+ start:3001 stop:3807 length:807 start_codon:yes stop_codon:yes gene_type:complete